MLLAGWMLITRTSTRADFVAAKRVYDAGGVTSCTFGCGTCSSSLFSSVIERLNAVQPEIAAVLTGWDVTPSAWRWEAPGGYSAALVLRSRRPDSDGDDGEDRAGAWSMMARLAVQQR